MNINVVIGCLLATAIGLHIAYSFFVRGGAPPSELPWVPIQVGKQRSFVNQTSDAGMFIEATRRKAIIGNVTNRWQTKDVSNGSMEYYFLTGICTCIPRACPLGNVIADGGSAATDTCEVLDGNGQDILDFGNANTDLCKV
jgi:hypothetical protein